MNKNKIILILALVLGLITVWLVYQNKRGTIQEELRDFAVSDTTSITKIFLANKNNHAVTLERKSNLEWTVNGKYRARAGGIHTILATIKNLFVKAPVAKAGYNGVIKGLAAEGIKCEIYQHGENKPMKVYYVGGSTADVLGTFMLLENSNLPFVIEIRGFQGYLTPRYSPFEEDWRDRSVFDYKPEDIKKISIHYFQDPSKSFSIERTGNRFSLFSLLSSKAIAHADTFALNNYFSLFNFLCFENWDRELTALQRDSLKLTTPVSTISVTDQAGKINTMITFPKPLTSSSLAQTDSLGNPLKYDMDRMYASINDGKDFVIIQHYVFGKIFLQCDDFNLDKKRRVR